MTSVLLYAGGQYSNTFTALLTHVWLCSVGHYSKMELSSLRKLAFNTEHIYCSLDKCMVILRWAIFHDEAVVTALLIRVWLCSSGQYCKMELLSQERLAYNTEHIYCSLDPCMVVHSWTIFHDGAVVPEKIGF